MSIFTGLLIFAGIIVTWWIGFGDGREAGRKRSIRRLENYCLAANHEIPCLACHDLSVVLKRKGK